MTGQYVTFVDSDDYIADNMIEKFIETVKLYQCNMVVAGMNIIDKNNQIYDYRRTLTSTLSTGIDITRKLLKDVFLLTSFVLKSLNHPFLKKFVFL